MKTFKIVDYDPLWVGEKQEVKRRHIKLFGVTVFVIHFYKDNITNNAGYLKDFRKNR